MWAYLKKNKQSFQEGSFVNDLFPSAIYEPPVLKQRACVCSLVISALLRTLLILAPDYYRFPAGCCHVPTGGPAALRLLCRSGPLRLAPLLSRIQSSSSGHMDLGFVSYLQLFLQHCCDAHALATFLGHLLVKAFIAGWYVLLG